MSFCLYTCLDMSHHAENQEVTEHQADSRRQCGLRSAELTKVPRCHHAQAKPTGQLGRGHHDHGGESESKEQRRGDNTAGGSVV